MIRILYVDDEDLLLDLAKIFLEKSGEFSVDISTTAVGLADSSRISSYEAIISDYQMPDMNGIEFLKEIRKRYPDLPFILFTGRGREEVVIEAINNGADFYLQKGGDPKAQFAELNHKVLQAVKRRRTERELYNSENNAREILETLRKTQSVAHVGNWVLDLKTNRYTASDEALQLIGLSPGISPTFEDIANIIHPEDRPRIRDLFVHSLTTGESYSTEMRIILPTTGEMRYLATFGEIKQDKNGKPVQVFGVNQDITELKNTSCALAEHETQFRQIIDNLPISISIVTLDGKILYANPEAVKLFEFDTIEQLYNTKAPDVWADIHSRNNWVSELKKSGIVTNFEMDLITPSGKKFWAIGFGIIIMFQGQECVLSALHDITDRKLAEEELKKGEEKFRFITDNTLDVIWTLNFSGQFTYVSPSVYHLRGYTPQEVMDSPLTQAISPGSLQKSLDAFNRATKLIKQGKTPDPVIIEIEQPCKDGSSVWTEVVARPFYDKWGDAVGFIGVSRDITKRKIVEEKLKENEIKFITIFNQTPDPILILDQNGKILEVNQGFHDIFGHNDEEVLGKTIEEMRILSIDQNGFHDLLNNTWDDIHRQEMMFVNQSKIPFIAEVAISHFRIRDDPYSLIQIHDINEIRKSHDAAQKANNKLNILSSITRHDILNRVMIASLYSEELKEAVHDPTLTRYVETISQASRDIEHLIKFTKEYEDLGTSAPGWQRVETLILEPTIQDLAHGIQIQSELGELEIYADMMLEKVLYNLTDNSIRHGHTLSWIRYSYRKERDGCILIYEDDGGGVLIEEKEKIFERGFGKNTGMGLFLIREILSITGISIQETGTYGDGVRFEMKVPAGKWRILPYESG